MNHTIPDQILVAGEFFGPDFKDEPMLVGKVVAILRDTDNDQSASSRWPTRRAS